jgi:hypothetical protein
MTRPPLSRGSREHPLTRAPHVIVLPMTRSLDCWWFTVGLMPSSRGGPHELLYVFISCWDFLNPQRSIVPSGSGA